MTPAPRKDPFIAGRRTGSALIIVIVLLVLLALIGTAYVTTSHGDRVTSIQNLANTQADLDLKGAMNLVKSSLVSQLFDYQLNAATGTFPGVYRPAPVAAATDLYGHFTSPYFDLPLAERIPISNLPTTPAFAFWPAVSYPPEAQASGSYVGRYVTDLPLIPANWPAGDTPQAPLPYVATGTIRKGITTGGVTTPASWRITPFTSASGQMFQGLTLCDSTGAIRPILDPTNAPLPQPLIAGDADGDGIADSLLFKLPVTGAGGVSYYAAVRVVDNNSAINVATALSAMKYPASLTPPNMPGQFFTSNVDLFDFLLTVPSFTTPFNYPGDPQTNTVTAPYGQIERLNMFRWNTTTPTATPSLNPVYDPTDTPQTALGYTSVFDATTQELGRRLSNPGFAGPGVTYEALTADSTANIASRFILRLSDASNGGLPPNPGAGETEIERALTGSLNFLNGTPPSPALVRTTPYAPNQIVSSTGNTANFWFDENFNYPSGSFNRRPLLVGNNAVSNAIQVKAASFDAAGNPLPGNPAMMPYGDRGYYNPNAAYSIGDLVWFHDTVALRDDMYVCVQAVPAKTAGTQPLVTPGSPQYWTRPEGTWQVGSTYKQFDLVSYSPATSPVPGVGFLYYATGNPTAGKAPDTDNAWVRWAPSVGRLPTKTSPNTACFAELWRAYWSVMAQQTNVLTVPITTPFGNAAGNVNTGANIYFGMQYTAGTYVPPALGTAGSTHPQRMFRSSIRDPRGAGSPTKGVFLPAEMEMQLRAALAAVNTEDLRNPNDDATTNTGTVSAHEIHLLATVEGTANVPVNAVVYGTKKQPYITEVYVNTDVTANAGASGTANTSGYMAIELYNPYSFDLTLTGWELATVDRSGTGYPGLPAPVIIADFTQSTGPNPVFPIAPKVPAHGYLLLENYQEPVAGAPTSNASYRPAATGLPVTGPVPTRTAGQPPLNKVYVQNLTNAIGKELVLLRRRTGSGAPSSGTVGEYTWNDAANVTDMVPVDSFDFTGLVLGSPTANPPKADAWHYDRACIQPDSSGNGRQWEFVYPGRYDGTLTFARQQGTQTETYNPAAAGGDPWGTPGPTVPPITLGGNAGIAANNDNILASYEGSSDPNHGGTPYSVRFPIQLAADGWASPTNTTSGATNTAHFPFNGFARNGDILEVPYIGAYVITLASNGALLEWNPVTMDAAFAEDTDVLDDTDVNPNQPTDKACECVGRFCPLVPPKFPVPAGTTWDETKAGDPTNATLIRYGWASSLFDYLSVQVPRNEFYPELGPSLVNPGVLPQSVPIDPTGTSNPAAIGGTASDTLGVEGLININTASAQVLGSLPLVLYTDATGADPAPSGFNPGDVDRTGSMNLAQAIVTDRFGNGPFKTVFDLNRVNWTVGATAFSFPFVGGTIQSDHNTLHDPGNTQGDISPLNTANAVPAPTDGVRNDFEERYLAINRISNMITTRSDTFTCYILIQAWQNAGTTNATLVGEKRAAFILDRNQVTPAQREPVVTPVPAD